MYVYGCKHYVHMHVEAIIQSWSLYFPSDETASVSHYICFLKKVCCLNVSLNVCKPSKLSFQFFITNFDLIFLDKHHQHRGWVLEFWRSQITWQTLDQGSPISDKQTIQAICYIFLTKLYYLRVLGAFYYLFFVYYVLIYLIYMGVLLACVSVHYGHASSHKD